MLTANDLCILSVSPSLLYYFTLHSRHIVCIVLLCCFPMKHLLLNIFELKVSCIVLFIHLYGRVSLRMARISAKVSEILTTMSKLDIKPTNRHSVVKASYFMNSEYFKLNAG